MVTMGSADVWQQAATVKNAPVVCGTVDPSGLYLVLVDLLREYGALVMAERGKDENEQFE
jgi:hypothetical protein